MSIDMGAAFGYLDKAETALDGLQGWLDNTFDSIGVYGQEGADAVCQWAGEWVSYKIEQIEAQVVKGLHGAYMGALGALQIVAPLYALATGGISADLGALVTAALKLAMPWVPPCLDAIQTMAQVPMKIVSVASKASSLASYRPPLPANTTLDLSKFKVHAKTISMGDVMSGSFQVGPPPEPFTTYMKASIAKTKQNIKDTRKAQGQTTSFKEAVGIKNNNQKISGGFDGGTTIA